MPTKKKKPTAGKSWGSKPAIQAISLKKVPSKAEGVASRMWRKGSTPIDAPPALSKGDPEGGGGGFSLPDGRRVYIGNPDQCKPVESLESRIAREKHHQKQAEYEFMALKSWIETHLFQEEGTITLAAEEKLCPVPDDFFVSGFFDSGIQFTYGKKADWRTALCVLARKNQEYRKLLSWCLTKAAAEANTVELKAFQKAAELIRKRESVGRIGGKMAESQLQALHFVLDYFQKNKTYPIQDEVEQWIKGLHLFFPERGKKYGQGSKNHRFFDGPILSKCPANLPWHRTS